MTTGPHDPKTDYLPGKKSKPISDSARWERLWERGGTPLMIFAVVGLILLAGWLITETQRSSSSQLAALSPEQAESLRQRSLQNEATFENRRLNKPILDEADIALLGEAVQAQEDYLAARGALASENARLETIRRRYHVIQAERLRAMATEAEQLATSVAKTDNTAAAQALRRAVEAERLIESRWFFSGYADVGKIARLDTRLRRLEAQPFWEKTRAEEAAAEALFAQGQLEAAATKLGLAIETEQAFVEKYRDVLETEFARAERLADRQATIRSHPLYLQIKGAEDAAQAALKRLAVQVPSLAVAAEQRAAAAAYDQAYRLQLQLLQEFPRSEWATVARRDNFEYLRNRWRVAPELSKIQERAQLLAQNLRAGQADDALALAGALQAELQAIEVANPGVILPSDPLRRQFAYLTTHAATLRAVLPKMVQLTAEVPGSKVRMMKQEISQGFYTTVLGSNPSAVVRENLPVESVAYVDAVAFGEALGWICGRTVRLPTLAEYKAALGDLSQAPSLKNAWTFDNTDGVTAHPVGLSTPNAAGFFDLLGNAEEWVWDESPAGADDFGSVVGGSVNWVPVPGLPLRKALKREKSRTIGFRIVIE